jgi:hypothetical protein
MGTPEEFERAQMERLAAAFNISFEKVARQFGTRPFGKMTDKWRVFVAKIEPKDELWSFRNSDEAFAKKLGCQGFAIVRDGIIRETFVTSKT